MVSGEDEEGEAFRVALAVCLAAHVGSGGREQLEATMQVGSEWRNMDMTMGRVRKFEMTDTFDSRFRSLHTSHDTS